MLCLQNPDKAKKEQPAAKRRRASSELSDNDVIYLFSDKSVPHPAGDNAAATTKHQAPGGHLEQATKSIVRAEVRAHLTSGTAVSPVSVHLCVRHGTTLQYNMSKWYGISCHSMYVVMHHLLHGHMWTLTALPPCESGIEQDCIAACRGYTAAVMTSLEQPCSSV